MFCLAAALWHFYTVKSIIKQAKATQDMIHFLLQKGLYICGVRKQKSHSNPTEEAVFLSHNRSKSNSKHIKHTAQSSEHRQWGSTLNNQR